MRNGDEIGFAGRRVVPFAGKLWSETPDGICPPRGGREKPEAFSPPSAEYLSGRVAPMANVVPEPVAPVIQMVCPIDEPERHPLWFLGFRR